MFFTLRLQKDEIEKTNEGYSEEVAVIKKNTKEWSSC
jgi:hypothetical protein